MIARHYGKSGPLIAATFHAVATGTSKPLSQLIDAWTDAQARRGLAQKTIAQMKSDVEVLVQHLPTSNLLIAEHTSQWIQLMASKGSRRLKKLCLAYDVLHIFRNIQNCKVSLVSEFEMIWLKGFLAQSGLHMNLLLVYFTTCFHHILLL